MTKPPDAHDLDGDYPHKGHGCLAEEQYLLSRAGPLSRSASGASAQRLDSIRDGLQRLHEDAKRWLTENLDRSNLRAAELRIAKLVAFAAGEADRLKIRRESDDGGVELVRDEFASRVLDVLRSSAGRIAITEALHGRHPSPPHHDPGDEDGDR